MYYATRNTQHATRNTQAKVTISYFNCGYPKHYFLM